MFSFQICAQSIIGLQGITESCERNLVRSFQGAIMTSSTGQNNKPRVMGILQGKIEGRKTFQIPLSLKMIKTGVIFNLEFY